MEQPQVVVVEFRPREFIKAKKYILNYRWTSNELNDYFCDINVEGLLKEVKRLKIKPSSQKRMDLVDTLFEHYTNKTTTTKPVISKPFKRTVKRRIKKTMEKVDLDSTIEG